MMDVFFSEQRKRRKWTMNGITYLLQERNAVSMYESLILVENGKEKEWATFDADTGTSEGTDDV